MNNNRASNTISTIRIQDINYDDLLVELRHIIRTELSKIALTDSKEDLMTCKQVEELLDISHQSRIEWTRQGILQSYSFGGRKTYYKRSEIIVSLIKIEH